MHTRQLELIRPEVIVHVKDKAYIGGRAETRGLWESGELSDIGKTGDSRRPKIQRCLFINKVAPQSPSVNSNWLRNDVSDTRAELTGG